MNKLVELNPAANGGESVTARLAFENRHMSMRISLGCYGSHFSEVFVAFDSPKDIRNLANALNALAQAAEDEFAANP